MTFPLVPPPSCFRGIVPLVTSQMLCIIAAIRSNCGKQATTARNTFLSFFFSHFVAPKHSQHSSLALNDIVQYKETHFCFQVEGEKFCRSLLHTKAIQALNATINPNKFPACSHLPQMSDEYIACQVSEPGVLASFVVALRVVTVVTRAEAAVTCPLPACQPSPDLA